MAQFIRHEEHRILTEAVEDYRSTLDGYQPTNDTAPSTGSWEESHRAAEAGEVLAQRVEQALRGTDWRVVEKRVER